MGPTQPSVQFIQGAFSVGVKWPELEADECPPSNDKIMNEWIYISALLMCLHGVHMDNSTSSTYL